VYGILRHELLLFFGQFFGIDLKRISEGYLLHLLIECVWEGLLDLTEAATTCGVGQDEDVLEARVLDVVLPDMQGMLFHRLVFGDWYLGLWVGVEVRVHDEHWEVLLIDSPVNLREHSAEIKVVLEGDLATPDTSSHRSRALYEHDCGLLGVRFQVRAVELLGHVYVALREFGILWQGRLGLLEVLGLRHQHLLHTILIDHCLLAVLGNLVGQMVVLLLVEVPDERLLSIKSKS